MEQNDTYDVDYEYDPIQNEIISRTECGSGTWSETDISRCVGKKCTFYVQRRYIKVKWIGVLNHVFVQFPKLNELNYSWSKRAAFREQLTTTSPV